MLFPFVHWKHSTLLMKQWNRPFEIKDQKIRPMGWKPITFFCSVPYLHGPGDEGDLRAWLQVLVDDEPAGPLAGPHYTIALDQHEQLGGVWQGIWAQVDKTGGLVVRSVNLAVQGNTGWLVPQGEEHILLKRNPMVKQAWF